MFSNFAKNKGWIEFYKEGERGSLSIEHGDDNSIYVSMDFDEHYLSHSLSEEDGKQLYFSLREWYGE